MKVLHVAAECATLASTGGLGEVIAALPAAQRALGLDAAIVLPRYRALSETVRDGPVVAVTQAAGRPYALIKTPVDPPGAPVYLLDMPEFFDRDGDPYRDADGVEHPDNTLRFARYAEAVARLVAVDPNFAVDIVHLHDWHAAAAAAWLRALQWRGRSVLTIHNLAFHGAFGRDGFDGLGLDDAFWDAARYAGDERRASCMGLGIACSDAVTAVSPRYAEEIQTPAFGCGLDPQLGQRAEAGALVGVLNGIDEQSWDPRSDRTLVHRYGLCDVVDGKRANGRALAQELKLAQDDRPLIAFVGRLTTQKGVDVLAAALPELLALPVRIVAVGVGDADLTQALQEHARRAPAQFAFCPVFDPPLVRRVLAAADAVLVPSRFEPCGLVQMYAQRYGALPVVRRVGGLADTVVDVDAAPASATGIVFDDDDTGGLLAAVRRFLRLAADVDEVTRVRRKAMTATFGWQTSAARYRQLYDAVRNSAGNPKPSTENSMSKTDKPTPGREQDRGPGARKVELERRLDANARLERQHAGDGRAEDAGKADAEAAAAERRRREKEAAKEDAKLDEGLEESFPASDPPALTTPVRTGG
ncbi:MAG: glycogen synthase GlgA [Pseudomonadota bacterium]|nr:glycogen synthase GlgA [Pseudomonadota bacterium]